MGKSFSIVRRHLTTLLLKFVSMRKLTVMTKVHSCVYWEKHHCFSLKTFGAFVQFETWSGKYFASKSSLSTFYFHKFLSNIYRRLWNFKRKTTAVELFPSNKTSAAELDEVFFINFFISMKPELEDSTKSQKHATFQKLILRLGLKLS